MYQRLLLKRYLTTKVLPLLAAVGVMLSTATVVVVWSIMDGFLRMLLDSGRALVGDVSIEWPTVGFGHYDELIKLLEADPMITAAAPVISTAALAQMPDGRRNFVQLRGVEGESYDRVTSFRDTLWWKPLSKPLPEDRHHRDFRFSEADLILGKELPALLAVIDEELGQGGRLASKEFAAPLRGMVEEVRADVKAAKNPELKDDLQKARAVSRGLDSAAGIAQAWYDIVVQNNVGFVAGKTDPNSPRSPAGALGISQRFERAARIHTVYTAIYADGLSLSKPNKDTGVREPAAVIGIQVSGFTLRDPDGLYFPAGTAYKRLSDGTFQPIDGNIINHRLTFIVLPLDESGSSAGVVSRSVPIANEFRSGLYEVDNRETMMELGMLQRMLKMDAAERFERTNKDPYLIIGDDPPPGTPSAPDKVIGEVPARVTTVIVRGKDGADLLALHAKCRDIYRTFAAAHTDVPDPERINISTWKDQNATMIAAVEKEIGMMLVILGVVSLTVSFMILSIFWAIVSEKTKDIGILRAIGASRRGVAWIWLSYGLAIGVIGAGLGIVAGHLIVWNINGIHDWLGKTFGLTIWNPEIYYFFTIPNTVKPMHAILVVASGIVFSVLGAVIPAIRAANMDPVKSLRFE